MKKCLNCKQRFDHEGWQCFSCGFSPLIHKGYTAFAPELLGSEDEYDPVYFEQLATLEQGHFWFEARNRLLNWIVQRYFPRVRNLWEVGCGTGFVLKGFQDHFANVQLFGSDLLAEGLEFAAQRVPSAQLFQADARCVPFEQEFDVIGAFDVIEHITEDTIVLTQLFQALKPGGGLMLTVPQHRFLWSMFDDFSHHKRRYTRHELEAKVQDAGFNVLMVTSFVSLLLPFMMASRLMSQRKNPNETDAIKLLQIGKAVNRMFGFMMKLEFIAIRSGLRFPFGGSLLLIAQRPLATERMT